MNVTYKIIDVNCKNEVNSLFLFIKENYKVSQNFYLDYSYSLFFFFLKNKTMYTNCTFEK